MLAKRTNGGAGSEAPNGPEFLRSLYEHTATGVEEVAPDGRIVFVNPAFCQMVGLRRDDLLHKRFDDLVAPEDRAREIERFRKMHSSSQWPIKMQMRYLHRSGVPIPANVTSLLVNRDDPKGSIVSFVQDTAEAAAFTEQFGVILDSAPNAMLLVSESGKVIMANLHAEHLFGYGREELSQQLIESIVPATFRSEHELVREAHRENPERRMMGREREVVARHKDGSEVPVQVSLYPIHFRHRNWVLASIFDIWDRKKTELALRDSEDRLRLLLDSTSEGILGLDLDGQFTFCNRSALHMLGYGSLGYGSEDQLNGRTFHDLIHQSSGEGSHPAQECPVMAAVRTGSSAHSEDDLFRMADGGTFHAECWCNPQRTGADLVGAVVAFVDISSRLEAAEALRKSEERFEKAFRESPMALALTSTKDHRFVEVNDTYLRFTGYRREEVVGKTPLELNIWVNPAERAEVVRRALQEGSFQEVEMRYRTKDGSIRFGLGSVELIDFGAETFMLSGIIDITDRKLALQELRESEERFRTTFRSAPAGMAVMDPMGKILSVNNAFCELLDYSEQELVGMNVAHFTYPEDLAATVRTFSPGVRYDSERIEKRYVGKNGQERWADASRSLIRNSDGKPAYWISQLVDITDRKRAEEALRETEQRFRTVANSAPVMIWMSSRDKLCTFINQPWVDFTGRPANEQLGYGWLERIHPEDRAHCAQVYEESFDRREPFVLEYRLLRHDGQYRWIVDRGVPRTNPDGSFAGYIGSCSDDTERRFGVEALQAVSWKLLQAQEQERKRIAQELHDDINQRLALLAVQIEQLRDTRLKPTALGDGLDKLCKEATGISSDVQALSHRLHSPKLEYLGMIPAMEGICRELAERHRIKIDFVHKGVFSSVDEEESLGLFRIMQEALHNAVKHSGAKRFAVSVEEDSEGIRMQISDFGRGFHPELAMKGAGIGLVSMQERVKLMKGTISIRSRPGHGTEIDIHIPAKS